MLRYRLREMPTRAPQSRSVMVSASKLNKATRSVSLESRPWRSMQCSRNWRRHRLTARSLKLDSGVPQSQSGFHSEHEAWRRPRVWDVS
jgi:hypothetical protein